MTQEQAKEEHSPEGGGHDNHHDHDDHSRDHNDDDDDDHGHGHDHGEFHFYASPRQRQRWGETQVLPHTNFADTFFDLFYVAAAYNLGTLIRSSPTNLGVLYFLGCFYPIMMIWFQKMFYDARFDSGRDFYHRVYEFVVLVVLGTAVLYIRPVAYMSTTSDNEDMFAFSLCITLSSILALGRSLDVKRNVVGDLGAKRSAEYEFFWYGIMTSFYAAATIVSCIDYGSSGSDYGSRRFLGAAAGAAGETNHVPIALLFAGAFFHPMGIILSMFRQKFLKDFNPQEYTVPINIGFFIHRFGEWIMLMLGESVLSLLIVPTQSGDYYQAFFCGIVSITALEILHFRSQPHEADDHALRRSRLGGIVFLIFGQLYSAGLIVLGTSYKMILYEYVYEYDSAAYRRVLEENGVTDMTMYNDTRYLAGSEPPILDTADRRQRVAHFFCISMAVVWFCLDAMLLAHKGVKFNMKRCSESTADNKREQYFGMAMAIMRTAMIVVFATLSQYVTNPGLLALLGLIGIVVQVMLRVAGSFAFDHENTFDVASCTNDINGPKSLMCKASLRLKGMTGKQQQKTLEN